jgi:putative tryptophan/tyrosine transport system substrate-binding protein
MVTALDPVGSGYVDSLARPGGKVTGLSLLSIPLSAKRLEFVRDVASGSSRIALLWNPEAAGTLEFAAIQAAAQSLGLEVLSLEVSQPEDLGRALDAVVREGSGAVLFQQAAIFAPPQARSQILDFSATHRLPAMYPSRSSVEEGGLMSHGASVRGNFRRAAYYVDRILRGSSPADLPVQQPREFEFVINLQTAQALGLTLPPHVLLQATEVLQ